MKSKLVKRTVTIDTRKIQFCIEQHFWTSLEEIAVSLSTGTSQLLASIYRAGGAANMSSAVRTYVIDHFQTRLRDAELDDAVRQPAHIAAGELNAVRPRWLH